MGKKKVLVPIFFDLICLFNLLTGIQGFQSSAQHLQQNVQQGGLGLSKMFVFGDSYADTGNIGKSVSSSWKPPYGITFPGKPAGRFSDGRVLTDYLDMSVDPHRLSHLEVDSICVDYSPYENDSPSFMGIKSPVTYKGRKMGRKTARYGMNFAYGGTGVFQTLVPEPNMTTQILFFQRIVHDNGLYTAADIASSLALVSLAGNDYGAYYARGGSAQGLPAFITSVINQLALNLKQIHDMGVKKIAVTALEPMGCLPQSTVTSSYQQCNGSQNTAVNLHNLLMQQAVAKLNNETKDSAFHILDLYGAFMSTFKTQGISILKPCCVGMKEEFSCGSVDERGVKQYTVCENPDFSFFWDDVHPSQSGWRFVYSALQASLYQL